jgi:alkylation response protein AidB-like acyl-CoA dehydrogenase
MPVFKAPIRDYQFIINDFLGIDKYPNIEGFKDALEMKDALLDAGAQFTEEVLFPLNQSGDAEGLKHDKATGTVTLPKGFKEAYKLFCEGGWPSFTCDPKYGGQGLPEFLNMPVIEMICSANLSFGITPGLSHGAYNAIYLHANDELKNKYLPKMVTGEWSGVMCLTEPQCGTDLGLIRTKAEPNKEGSYAISGTKIFISSGEQDLTENIIHLVLAKLPGAPSGTKGISLFLVPKMMVKDDGSLGEKNGVKCASIEHKMGIHASPTCVMNYDNAVGWLVGEPNKGMRAMFTMMNAARLYVGVQGLGLAEVAYQNALSYAKERLQMRAITGAKFPDKPADPIIVHPDVRRMLLTSKAFCEGARSLAMEVALKLDIAHRSTDPDVKRDCDDFVQLMTPIVKSYLTDGGSEVANLAVQVFGGYGFITEYGVEQYVRDARIAQIYEGTNGIQALDLVGRKLPTGTGRYLRQFFHPADAFITLHKDNAAMAEFIKPLSKNIGYLQQASLYIARAGLTNPDDGAAAATDYLKMFALVVMAFQWARMAEISQRNMDKDKEFYTAKIATARFFYTKILPQVAGLGLTMPSGSKPLMDAVL